LVHPLTYYKPITHKLLGNKCQQCGTNEDLVLHHIDLDRNNNEPNNLQLLCRSCHRKLHAEKTPYNRLSIPKTKCIPVYLPEDVIKTVQRIIEEDSWWEDPQTFILSAIRQSIMGIYPEYAIRKKIADVKNKHKVPVKEGA